MLPWYKKLTLICCLCWLPVLSSLAAQIPAESDANKTIAQIFLTLSSMQNHSGTFTQTKTLNGLSFPIISQGSFVFAKNRGLYNEINKPLFQALTYSANGIIEWNEKGEQINNNTHNPAEHYVSEMLLAFFNGDQKHINEIFTISSGRDSANSTNSIKLWQLILTPNNKAMQDYLQQITINGDKHIEKIMVYAKNGDQTEILFTHILPVENLAPYCQYFPDALLPEAISPDALNVQCSP